MLYYPQEEIIMLTTIQGENDSIIIKKASRKRRARKSLEELFVNYKGKYKCEEWDTGKPVGKEVW